MTADGPSPCATDTTGTPEEEWARWPGHGAGFGRLKGQRYPQRDAGDQVYPKDHHRRYWQHTSHEQGQHHSDGFACIGGQLKADDLSEVVIDRASLADSRHDGCEVVVGQHKIGCLLGGLGPFQPHCYANIGAL